MGKIATDIYTFEQLRKRGYAYQGLAIEPRWDWSKSWPVIHRIGNEMR